MALWITAKICLPVSCTMGVCPVIIYHIIMPQFICIYLQIDDDWIFFTDLILAIS